MTNQASKIQNWRILFIVGLQPINIIFGRSGIHAIFIVHDWIWTCSNVRRRISKFYKSSNFVIVPSSILEVVAPPNPRIQTRMRWIVLAACGWLLQIRICGSIPLGCFASSIRVVFLSFVYTGSDFMSLSLMYCFYFNLFRVLQIRLQPICLKKTLKLTSKGSSISFKHKTPLPYPKGPKLSGVIVELI